MDVLFRIIGTLLFLFITVSCSSESNDNQIITKNNVDACKANQIDGEYIVHWKDGHYSLLKSNSIVSLEGRDDIISIDKNYRVYFDRPTQLNLDNKNLTLSQLPDTDWGYNAINVTPLVKLGYTGKGTIVAVIDSGIDTTHPQLQHQLFINEEETFNGLDDDNNGLIDDVHGYNFTKNTGELEDLSGHGTHVAGIIAAEHDAGKAKGIAPGSKLLVYGFINQAKDGDIFDAIKSIQAATQLGAKVINASWGGAFCSLSLKEAIEEAGKNGVLFVTAAGNERLNIDLFPSYPAAFQLTNLISVGASTIEGFMAGFSNRGNRVHLVAPGEDVFSTYSANVLFDTDGDNVQDSSFFYWYDSGTSMAAPFVAGAAAILLEAFPEATPFEIKKALIDSTKPGPFPVLSRGEMDVFEAFNQLSQIFTPIQPPPLSPEEVDPQAEPVEVEVNNQGSSPSQESNELDNLS